jgi:hypothetical protein
VLGVDHPDTLTNMYCLAHLFGAEHRHDEALRLYDRAIAGYNKTLGPMHPITRACQNHKAELSEKMRHGN